MDGVGPVGGAELSANRGDMEFRGLIADAQTRAPIVLFDNPSTRSSSTSISRGVSGSVSGPRSIGSRRRAGWRQRSRFDDWALPTVGNSPTMSKAPGASSDRSRSRSPGAPTRMTRIYES